MMFRQLLLAPDSPQDPGKSAERPEVDETKTQEIPRLRAKSCMLKENEVKHPLWPLAGRTAR